MLKFLKIMILVVLGVTVTACTGSDMSTKVKPMQRKDKRLSCKEILLEMNEAEFYRKMAYKNRGPKIKNVLMPLGYISTYMDAEEAIDAAEARVNYLDKIYDIMDCDNRNRRSSRPIGSYQQEQYPEFHGSSYVPAETFNR